MRKNLCIFFSAYSNSAPTLLTNINFGYLTVVNNYIGAAKIKNNFGEIKMLYIPILQKQ